MVLGVISVGFILEKKSDFYSKQLVKNSASKFEPPPLTKENLSVFYDRTFNITREGKLFAMSDYVCRLAKGKSTHAI